MVTYALLCDLVIGIHRLNAALARRRVAWRDAPRTIVTPAELALARARRWCSLRGRRASTEARGV